MRRGFRHFAPLALGAAMASTAPSGLAQETGGGETRIGEEGFVSPPASIYEMHWLEGQWLGEGLEGAPAQESWLPPVGTTMVGTFVQENPDGGIRFTEHLYLMEEGDSLVLRLKHFNADLTGWEEKNDTTDFRLLALEPCAAFFHGLTLRCDGDHGLLAAVRMRRKDGTTSELLFRFTRAPQPTVSYDCDGSTAEMDACMLEILERSQQRKAQYLAAALERFATDEGLAKAIEMGDASFEAYRENECGAVYEQWREGTIRNMMSLTCSIGLTDERTRTIWSSWLAPMDSSPPILPEPQPTR